MPSCHVCVHKYETHFHVVLVRRRRYKRAIVRTFNRCKQLLLNACELPPHQV